MAEEDAVSAAVAQAVWRAGACVNSEGGEGGGRSAVTQQC